MSVEDKARPLTERLQSAFASTKLAEGEGSDRTGTGAPIFRIDGAVARRGGEVEERARVNAGN